LYVFPLPADVDEADDDEGAHLGKEADKHLGGVGFREKGYEDENGKGSEGWEDFMKRLDYV